jgi:hypothetical protein
MAALLFLLPASTCTTQPDKVADTASAVASSLNFMIFP